MKNIVLPLQNPPLKNDAYIPMTFVLNTSTETLLKSNKPQYIHRKYSAVPNSHMKAVLHPTIFFLTGWTSRENHSFSSV